jgi:hypothetical protein
MNADEQRIADLLQNKRLRVEEYTKRERRQGKTPDFRVLKGDELVLYCEVKSISKDEWLGGPRPDPILNTLTDKIHNAVQQFDGVNPDLTFPNVLAFVNHNEMCGAPDLREVLTGYLVTEDGKWHRISRKFSDGRIEDEKFRIHLYIWIECTGGVKVKAYFPNVQAKEHLNSLCNHFGIDRSSVGSV